MQRNFLGLRKRATAQAGGRADEWHGGHVDGLAYPQTGRRTNTQIGRWPSTWAGGRTARGRKGARMDLRNPLRRQTITQTSNDCVCLCVLACVYVCIYVSACAYVSSPSNHLSYCKCFALIRSCLICGRLFVHRCRRLRNNATQCLEQCYSVRALSGRFSFESRFRHRSVRQKRKAKFFTHMHFLISL